MNKNHYQHRRTLASLAHGIRRCRKCRLCETRSHAVPGEGPEDARVMFVGEAPGETEDLSGRPFRGRSGRFLDRLLDASGISREAVFITGSVKCRPPGNRNPKRDEFETCRDAWLERQVERIDPALIVLLGGVALKQVLGENGPLGDFRGRLTERNGRPVLPTYHPSAGMRFPPIGEAMHEDFAKILPILADHG